MTYTQLMRVDVTLLLFGGGIVQGVFLATVLCFLDVRNRIAARLLAALVLVMTVMIAGILVDASGVSPRLNGGLAIEFAIGPLIYLFVCAIGAPEYRFDRHASIHFLTFVVALLALVSMSVIFADQGFSSYNPSVAPYIVAWTIIKLPYFFTYAWFADRALFRKTFGARRQRAVKLKQLLTWFRVFYVLVGLLYLYFITGFLGLPRLLDADLTGALLLIVSVYLIAYFVIGNRQLLDFPSNNRPVDQGLVQRVLEHMSIHRPYLNPDFSPERLASEMGVDVGSLSQSLAANYEGGFLELINDLRVTAFDELLKSSGGHDRTILEMAFEAGFNSKATFYRAFKAAKKTTPTQYRKNLESSGEFSASQHRH